MSDLNLSGRTIGRFEILAELGRGGMAVVYRARQTDLERIVALKVLPRELSYDQNYIARFHQEARSAAGLEHPHIVPIFEIGAAEGLQYIAMKYIAGGTLKDVVDKQGRMSLEQVVIVLEQIAGALDYAHSQGVIHRDIKPSNIMIAENGWAYLTDFGLARSLTSGGMTMAGTVMGTPEYMSPEQAQGLPTIGTPTDIYALGVVVYELLTGQMPFQADTPMGMLIARLQQAPRPPRDYRGDLPEAVEDVIMRALARKPEARFPTAGALVQALKQAAKVQSTPRMPVSPPLSPPHGTPLPVTDATTVLPAASQPTMVSSSSQPTAMMPNTPLPTAPMQANPRMATPPNLQAASLPAAAPQARKSGGKGLLVGLGVLLMVLVLGAGGFFFVQQRSGSQAQGALNDAVAAFSEKNGFDRALQHYDAALAIDPNLLEAQTGRARIFILRGHYEQAEQAARAAIAIKSDDALAHALLAESLSSRGEYSAGLEAAERAISLDSEHSCGYNVRAMIRADLAALESDASLMQKAVDDAEQALTLANTQDTLAKAMAHRARGYVYWQEFALDGDDAKLDSGIESFNQAIQLQDQIAELYTNIGYFYESQGKSAEALAQFELAQSVDSNYGHAHSGLGWNLYYLGDYQGALNEFDQALSFAPEDTDALLGKSVVYQFRSEPDYDAAIAVLEQALKIAPNSPSVLAEMGWAYRNKAGTTLDHASEEQRVAYAEAEHFFREALSRNDEYYYALNGLGWVLREQAEMLPDPALFQEAIQVLDRSVKLRSNQPYVYETLGWSYFGSEQYDEAVKAFTEVIELEEDYDDAYYGIGRAYEELGDLDNAKKAYRDAADRGSWQAEERLSELP